LTIHSANLGWSGGKLL